MKSILSRIILFSSLFVLIIPSLSQATEQRLALVIGNSNYNSGPLKNPVNDAADIADALTKLGFKVILKRNSTLRTMEASVQDFGKRLKQGGVGLFYFAGHGLQVNGVNYLVPVGAKIDKETDVKYEAMDAGVILDEMSNANNGLNIVILDACRDNPLSRQFRSSTRGLAILSAAPVGSYISYSTGPGQVARDGDGRNSPFASALLTYITEPGLAIEQVFKKVRQRLGQKTGGKQIPWELSSLQGDFFFDPTRRPAAGRSAADAEDKDKTIIAAKARSTVAKPKVNLPPFFKDAVTGMEFILIKGGCFQMGDTFGDGLMNEKPVHEVCIDDFYLGKYEVTQGQWQKVMNNNPSHFKDCGADCPVESVTWADAQSYIAELNRSGKEKYRLPTEAEWEYAARDGGKSQKWAGTSSEGRLGEYAWYEANSGDRLRPTGQKKPNETGLHDMSGNVWEWTGDWYGENYYQISAKENPAGPEEGAMRVVRGGCWLDRSADIRSSIRYFFAPQTSFKSIGFRLVRMAGE